jgi:hypothetical protein
MWDAMATETAFDIENTSLGPRELGTRLVARAASRHQLLHYQAAANSYLRAFAARGVTPSRQVSYEDVVGYMALRIGEQGLSSREVGKVTGQLKAGLTALGFTWDPEIDKRKSELKQIIQKQWPAPDKKKSVPIDKARLVRALRRLAKVEEAEAATVLQGMLVLGFLEILRGHESTRILIGWVGEREGRMFVGLGKRKTGMTESKHHKCWLEGSVGPFALEELIRANLDLHRADRSAKHHLFPYVSPDFKVEWDRAWTSHSWIARYRQVMQEPGDSEETISNLTPHGYRAGGAYDRKLNGEDETTIFKRADWVPGSRIAKTEYLGYAARMAAEQRGGKAVAGRATTTQ